MLRPLHIAVLGSAMLGLAFAQTAKAAEAAAPRLVTVTGEGSVTAAPDMAILSIGVLKLAPTARQALDENNKALSAVISNIKNAGVEARDIQTANFSVSPQYDYGQKAGERPKLVGYQVSNTLTVRVRDLSKLGKLLDEAVTNGINSGGSLSFANSNLDELMSKARQQAVKDAIAEAKELTEAAGVSLGDVMSISQAQPAPPYRPAMRLEMAKQTNSMPVEAGENSYTAHVTMTFAIKP